MAINLLPRQLQTQQARSGRQVIANAVSIVLLVILTVSVAVLFSYRVAVTKQYSALRDQVRELSDQVSTKTSEDVEWLLKNIHERITTVQGVQAKQYTYGDMLEVLKQYAGDGINFDTVSVTAVDDISISGSTRSLIELAGFVKIMNKEEVPFKDVVLSDLRLDETDYSYIFSISLGYDGSVTDQTATVEEK
ncbi:hypothetical protein KC614_01390 [candidate division WWE3 bacterium]|uniref:PilN domain-containing protein n=1 Tax=candidate division WWE3 bacterium TaxID=2053526 RepID=A0A955RRV4_UNCKA|nr:hypothetical protein [candidate division WWE3 bacterium]